MDWSYVCGYFDGEGCAGVFTVRDRKAKKAELIWNNTHKESLERIQQFIGCGMLRQRRCITAPKGVKTTKPMYGLTVARRADLLRIIPLMLEHCIIKREPLLTVLDYATNHMKDQAAGYGRMAGLDEATLRDLYWVKQMSLQAIAELYGVTWTAVRHRMGLLGIPRRSGSEAGQIANRSSEAWAARGRKIAEATRKRWADPVFREKMTARIRENQAKRLATRAQNRQRQAAVE